MVVRLFQGGQFAARMLLVTWIVVCGFAGPLHAQRLHTVRRGDTLSKIARRYHVRVADLVAANRLGRNRVLRRGQELEIPPRGVVYVQRGDTLSRIARSHDCTVAELRRVNRLSRGARLRSGQRLRLPGYQRQGRAEPADYGEPEHPGQVRILGRVENRTILLRDADGQVPYESLLALGSVMRRTEDDPVEVPEARLAYLLSLISDHFGGRPVSLVSGFRDAGGRTSEASRHVGGAAADINIRDVSKRAIWDFCRSLRGTGCGLYPRSTFTHVDTRERPAQWVDWSRPGRRARYGTLRRPYRRRERRSPRRARVGRRITRPRALPREVQVREAENPAAEATASPSAAEAP